MSYERCLNARVGSMTARAFVQQNGLLRVLLLKDGEVLCEASCDLLLENYVLKADNDRLRARLPGCPGGQHDDAPLHPLLAAGFDPEVLRAAGIDPDEVCVEVSDGEE